MPEPEKRNALELSDEVCETESGEQGHLTKLSRYAKAKQHQVSVAEYILQHEPSLNKVLEALEGCSKQLWFRNWYTVGQYRLIGGCTCKKHLLCAMCALRRSAKTVHEVEKKILAVMAENPSLVPVLITMTVKNGESLNERYEHITSAKKRLLHARRNALHRTSLKNKSITRFIDGSFGSYEFKKGAGGHGWHPHSHEIALLNPSVVFKTVTRKGKVYECPVEFEKQLQAEWLELTKDSFMVDVRKITHVPGQTGETSLLKAICEASKYALKLNDIEHADQIHAYKVLSGRRLTFTYGSLWGIKIPDDLNDTIEDELKLLPYIDLCYSFYSGSYNLTEVTDTGDKFFTSVIPKKQKTEITPDGMVKHDRLAAASRFSAAVKEYVQKL
ncbi:MAG: protein rep [Desulforhopalus sp.]